MSKPMPYRGKCKDNGELVYGWFLEKDGKSYIISDFETDCYDGENTDLYATVWNEVDPETVGQYIGRTDDNGVELYSGMRVKFTNLILGRFSDKEQWAEGTVFYDEKMSGYTIKQGDAGWNLQHSAVVALPDNPELLEGGQ